MQRNHQLPALDAVEARTSEAQQGKRVLLKLLGVFCTQLVRSCRARDDRQFVRIHESPRRGVGRVLLAVEHPHPWHDLDVAA